MTTGPARRALALLLFLTGWLGLGVLAAAPASAHVRIVSTAPGEGARLSSAPAQVSVLLSESVGIQQDSLRVLDERGGRADTGPVFQPGEVAEELAVRLRPGLPDGSFRVEYAFLSTDSHPVRGTFVFVIGDGPLVTDSGTVSTTTATDATVDVISTGARWAAFAGVVLLGGLVFVPACRPAGRADPVVRKLVRCGCAVSGLAAVAAFLIQGPYVAGRGVSSLFSADLLATTLSVSYGKLLLLRLGAVAVLAVLAGRLLGPGPPLSARLNARYENLAMVAGFVVLLSFSASGHAAADPVPYFTITADLAHLGAIAVWSGGLVQLAVALRRESPGEDLAAVAARFSRIAAVSVAVVVLSGAFLGLRHLPSLSALWSSGYGLVLLAKLAAFGLLLMVANLSRMAVRRMAIRRETTGTAGIAVLTTNLTRLRLTVGTEVAIAVVLLGLAARLSTLSPDA
ncbi:copper resistance CopC/CopD family protein [Amycolatopsis nigrescens]|uniref:copper resistance CopC/CopD family protein n=1 Tax=Amycolatopsis nigrescens TaxID=381445 RepID=UPI0003802361|nr:copper resistance protein CopC [Amycolatopsis nigrescens]